MVSESPNAQEGSLLDGLVRADRRRLRCPSGSEFTGGVETVVAALLVLLAFQQGDAGRVAQLR
jgi:hypothetical protein